MFQLTAELNGMHQGRAGEDTNRTGGSGECCQNAGAPLSGGTAFPERTLDTFEVDPGVQQQWLRIMIPQYLRNDYGHGDDLGEAIVAVRGDEPIALAERLIREFLADQDSPGDDDEPYERVSVWQYQFERMIAVELLAVLYKRSSRGELIPMLYREHGLHYHYAVSLFQAVSGGA